MYKGPKINETPPGWVTVEQLRDNLVEYMMLQSPYKDLAKEEMPENMVLELEKSMTRLAIAIYRTGSTTSSPWYVYVDDKLGEIVTTGHDIVNFKAGTGVKLERLQHLIEGKDRGQTIKVNINTTDIEEFVKGLVKEKVDEIVNPPAEPDPLPTYFIAMCVNNPDYDILAEVEIPFSTSPIRVVTPNKAGDNYIFFSTPDDFGKPMILNSINKDISYQFTKIGQDIRPGYQPNSIWKRNSTYGSKLSTTFILTV